jgi:hypothetical protein
MWSRIRHLQVLGVTPIRLLDTLLDEEVQVRGGRGTVSGSGLPLL